MHIVNRKGCRQNQKIQRLVYEGRKRPQPVPKTEKHHGFHENPSEAVRNLGTPSAPVVSSIWCRFVEQIQKGRHGHPHPDPEGRLNLGIGKMHKQQCKGIKVRNERDDKEEKSTVQRNCNDFEDQNRTNKTSKFPDI